MWGMQNMGRNFGFMMYAPFTGTPLFSYFYAFMSAQNTGAKDSICLGRTCWQATFVLSTITSLIALVISFALWKRWKGRI
jgi:lipoprotein signal peptidase